VWDWFDLIGLVLSLRLRWLAAIAATGEDLGDEEKRTKVRHDEGMFLGEDVGVWLMFAWWDGTGIGSKEWPFMAYDCLYSKSNALNNYLLLFLCF
jgi:hypothetical protein